MNNFDEQKWVPASFPYTWRMWKEYFEHRDDKTYHINHIMSKIANALYRQRPND